MTTKRTKTTPAARKSAKKATSKPAAKKAPRKSAPKVAPVEVPADTGSELVQHVFRGTTYQLLKDDGGYHFGDLTFKSMSGFSKHLEKRNGPAEVATETNALLEHVETTLAKQPRQRSRKAPPVPKEMKAPAAPRVAPGATLTRVYKGREIVVRVQDDGTFLYEGQTFKSLSACAKHITGYPAISGPVFFRLVEPKAAAAKDGQ